MSNIEFDYADPNYYPPSYKNRNSWPDKKLAFSSKCIEDSDPFKEESMSSPKKPKKKSSRTKLNENNKNFRTGRWTKEEHKKFLEAIELYGRDWKKVQGYVGTRTSTQARSHAQKVLPHPSKVDGVIGSHNSTATTLTKSSPLSNKGVFETEFKKLPSVSDDDNSSEFAIFKVEKVRKNVIGRDRVNSENNVFRIPVDNNDFGEVDHKRNKNYARKYSMNIEFSNTKNDLIGSPIKEPIKEHLDEDDEDGLHEEVLDVPLYKHKTVEPKSVETKFFGQDSNTFFKLHEEKEEMNLEQPPWCPDFPMDIDNHNGQFNSLNPFAGNCADENEDQVMASDSHDPFGADMDFDNDHCFVFNNQNFGW